MMAIRAKFARELSWGHIYRAVNNVGAFGQWNLCHNERDSGRYQKMGRIFEQSPFCFVPMFKLAPLLNQSEPLDQTTTPTCV